MNGKITFGEVLSLGILLTVLAGGGYTLRSDIAQVRTDLSAEIDTRFGEVNRRISEVDRKVDVLGERVDELDRKVDVLGKRVNELQERLIAVEAIVRVWVGGLMPGGPGADDLSRTD